MKKTILDVGRKAGFSKSTVSLVLRDSHLVKDTTKKHILGAIREMGYHPNRVAQSLKTGSSHLVGLIIPDALNPFFGDCAQQMEASLLRHGFDMMMSITEHEREREKLCISRMVERRVDGLIMHVSATEEVETYLLSLSAGALPLILIAPAKRDIEIDSIFIDQESGTHEAVRYLIELGHRSIAFILGVRPHVDISERTNGLERALAEGNIVLDRRLMVHCGAKIEDAYNAASGVLKLKPRPTAIFALNDLLALGVMRAVKDAGLKVPEDISVVGVDDTTLGRFAETSLTTVATPLKELVENAVNMLMRRMRGNEGGAVQRVFLESKLIVRESTAKCRDGER